MEILTNRNNGQTIDAPFCVSDYNIHGIKRLAYDLRWFINTYMCSVTYAGLLIDLEDSDDMLEAIEDAIDTIQTVLSCLNPGIDVHVSDNDYDVTIYATMED